MKVILIFLYIGLSFTGKTQNLTGYWLPLKRLEQINQMKIDKCDSINEYPFKKIKFFNNKKVSLFGFDAADPSVCTIMPQKEKGSWQVKDSIFHTLYPQYIKGSKIVLKIKNDTLYVTLTKNGNTIFQKFIRKYGNVNLTDYMETEVGNVLLKGKYISNNGTSVIQIKDNGRMELPSKKGTGWNFVSYQFKNYAPGSCRNGDFMARGIVELTDNKGIKKQYFIKSTATGIDFYKIKKINYWWTDATTEFAFSLSSIK